MNIQELLVLWCCVKVVVGGGQIEMKLLRFFNPGGEGDNGHPCDGRFFITGSPCDHNIMFCVDNVNSGSSTSRCAYGQKQTGEISNQNTINFYSRAGRLSNPTTFHFNSWPGEVMIKVRVWDVDDNADDFVDYMSYRYGQVTPGRSRDTAHTDYLVIKRRTSLFVTVKVYCDGHYYGPRCDVFCRPMDSILGHFTCSERDGSKICMEGWQGPNCNIRTDPCGSSPCANGGNCSQLFNTFLFMCQCTQPFTGKYCTKVVNNCEKSPCVHGQCTNLIGSYNCSCNEGWQGTNCDTDINECQNFAGCRNGGSCINTQGSFHCSCSPGWTSQYCQEDIDECASEPCHGGAQCVNIPGSFVCECPLGLSGHVCDSDLNECEAWPCENNGTCVNRHGSFDCLCPDGWIGDQCDQDVDECNLMDICLNQGTCKNLNGSFECICPEGFKGLYCEIDIDECLESNCLNNATCVNTVGSYSCSCLVGFKGKFCEEDINECDSNPCLHEGTCIDGVNNFTCTCMGGWIGHDCGEEIDECLSNPCQNNALCIDLLDDFFCDCPVGWSSQLCDEDMDECYEEPCLHRGTCVNVPGSFMCQCVEGWGGTVCEEDIDECQLTPLMCGQGSCKNLNGTFECICPEGWFGQYCEEEVDLCSLTLCHNNGTCIQGDSTTSIYCQCLDGFTGNICETDINECNVFFPCQNNGICKNTIGGFVCDCADGYTGNLCEIDIDECQLNVCPSYATCLNTNGSFTCFCQVGEAMVDCTEMETPCGDSLCHNGAQCHEQNNSYTCECPNSFIGQFCNISNPCSPNPCENSGHCHAAETSDASGRKTFSYICHCTKLYNGNRCSYLREHLIDNCDESEEKTFSFDVYKPLSQNEIVEVQIALRNFLAALWNLTTDQLDLQFNSSTSTQNTTVKFNAYVENVHICIKELVSGILSFGKTLQYPNSLYSSKNMHQERRVDAKETQNWIENNWYIVAIALAIVVMFIVILVVWYRSHQKKMVQLEIAKKSSIRSFSSPGSIRPVVHNDHFDNNLNDNVALSFDNVLYTTFQPVSRKESGGENTEEVKYKNTAEETNDNNQNEKVENKNEGKFT